MTIPDKILQLVERFEQHLDAYKHGKYNETQVRREFIDPLFASLGWDVDNAQDYAEAYKEVVHEDAIKVGRATKAPDYSFRIGGVRKFFVEAKKPSVDIKEDTHPAYQLRRYAWSAKLALSIVTDFEEFAVYDCRIKPEQTDKAATARIMYLTFREYAQKWDELTKIFSKEAILKGAFDRYAESTKAKKGTAEVDVAFLQEIERWRDLLARNLALRNPQLRRRDLNFAVQRTIDRIIFLRICEDRGIEDYGKLMALQNGAQVYERLLKLFYQADDRYNSGIFHFKTERDHAERPDALTPALQLDDKVLNDILKNLYYPDSPYEFSVLPADILGQVYEQFLGKVIRLTAGHQAKVEEKPEVKKAGGVYYTPTYIVEYIVKHTVGKLLEGNSPKQAEKLAILDPACGSGSFLLGAYQYLLDWHRDAYLKDDPQKWSKGRQPRVYQNDRGEWKLTIDERKHILLNTIYGVDIDSQAVEVTKLSLLLKVLEGEDEQSISSQMALFQKRVLPDLSENIKCGNSLIGSDFYEGKQLTLLDEEEMYRVNAFDWEKEFPEIMQQGGFDAVIGNPPYGASIQEEVTQYFLSKYKLQNYQFDSYILFIEGSLNLLKKDGLLGFIIPNTWLLNLTSSSIRKYLFSNFKINNIVHHRFPVFSTAVVDTEIVIFSSTKPEESHTINIEIVHKDTTKTWNAIQQQKWINLNGKPVNLFEREEYQTSIAKLSELSKLDEHFTTTQGTKPFQVGKGKPKQTKAVVQEKPYVSEEKVDDDWRPLLRGSLMNRYQILWNNDYWIKFGDWLAEPRYSANYDEEKIIIRQTGDSLIATLDTEKFIVRDNLYTIIAKNEEFCLKYLLGLLNSRLLNWYYQKTINFEKGEALAQVKRGHIAQLPIKMIDFQNPIDKSRHDQMVGLVQRILDLHKQRQDANMPQAQTLLQRQIEATDRQIDRLVYALYGLTEEEIEIVEKG